MQSWNAGFRVPPAKKRVRPRNDGKDVELESALNQPLRLQRLWIDDMNGGYCVACVANDDHPASLDPRKIYRVPAEAQGMLRVVDEPGDDYLYPRAWSVRVELSDAARKALQLAA